MDFIKKKDTQGNVYYAVKSSDFELLNNSILNKGTAFTLVEREQFKPEIYDTDNLTMIIKKIEHDMCEIKAKIA